SIYKSVYKSWNGLSQAIDPLGNITAFEHTVQGQVAKVTDPAGTVIEYLYDQKEKMVQVCRQGKTRETIPRDAPGNATLKRASAGRTLVAWEIGLGTVDKVRCLGSGEKQVFTHDAHGRVIVAETPAGKATFTYDSTGKVQSDKRDGKGVAHDRLGNQFVATT